MKEIWKLCPEYEGRYEVSSLGRVRTIERLTPVNRHGKTFYKTINKRVMRYRKDRYGYSVLCMSSVTKRGQDTVHRLVALTFIKGHFKGAQVNHKNGVKTDNRACNLEWVTPRENVLHSFRVLGRKGQIGRSNPMAKLTEKEVRLIRKRRDQGILYKIIAEEFSISQPAARDICNRRLWKHI